MFLRIDFQSLASEEEFLERKKYSHTFLKPIRDPSVTGQEGQLVFFLTHGKSWLVKEANPPNRVNSSPYEQAPISLRGSLIMKKGFYIHRPHIGPHPH